MPLQGLDPATLNISTSQYTFCVLTRLNQAERAAALLCAEAKKIIAGKQRAGQAKDTPSYTAELAKLQSRLNNSQTELMKQRKIALAGEKSWKNKKIVDEKEKDLREVDAEIMRVEILTTPLGDERPSDDSIREMDAAVKSALCDVVMTRS